MLEKHIEFLICPNCNGSLKLESFKKFSTGRIRDGMLLCDCGLWYPIINGVPRILIKKLRHLISKYHSDFLSKYSKKLPKFEESEVDFVQEKTAESHDLNITTLPSEFKEWDFINKEWMAPLQPEFYRDKIVLDAGCRIGTHTFFPAKFGASLVIGIDIGETVEIAYNVNQEMDNVLIVQADLHDIPTRKIFDYIFSIGVLHHIPDPQFGFQKLLEKAKVNSTLLILQI